MNLSQVATPAQLVEQNNTVTPPNTSQLDALVQNLGLEETFDLALTLVQRLGTFHQSVIEDLKQEATELDRLVVWSADEQVLHTCYDLLKQVADND